jgi:hypothetical protein
VAAFIASQREQHGVPQAVSCRALGVSQSWFYKGKDGELPPRAARRQRLKAEVARLFAVREGKDGAPRVAAALREAGWTVSENTVAGLMREQGLAARPGRKGRKHTTRRGKGRWRAPDLVGRDFPAAGINRKWYGDGTEIPTGEGKLYLDSVLDIQDALDGPGPVVGLAGHGLPRPRLLAGCVSDCSPGHGFCGVGWCSVAARVWRGVSRGEDLARCAYIRGD